MSKRIKLRIYFLTGLYNLFKIMSAHKESTVLIDIDLLKFISCAFREKTRQYSVFLLHIHSIIYILYNFYYELFLFVFFLRKPASCLNDCPRPEVVKVVLI
jgi:hypothetical protein